MTISIDIGKFTAEIERKGILGKRSREVELSVCWHSCGIYQIDYHRPHEAKPHYVIVAEDWYPPDIHISFTPEQFEKVFELYPSAPKHQRSECYKPFYEDYALNSAMIDFGDDRLFQAFKDPCENANRVYMVDRRFTYGIPDTCTSVLGLHWKDFQLLKDLIDSKKNEIFYSGCKVSWPS